MLDIFYEKIKKNYIITVCKIIDKQELAYKILENHISETEKNTFANFKNEKRQNEWLTIRLIILKYLDKYYEIKYKSTGKPYINNKYNISISHTKQYASIIFSKNENPGIDIETLSEKTIKISEKFMYNNEIELINDKNKRKFIFLNWSAKETLFKICKTGNIDFKKNLKVFPSEIKKSGKIKTEIILSEKKSTIILKYKFFEKIDNILVWYKGNKKRKMFFEKIYKKGQKHLAVLIDPDKQNIEQTQATAKKAHAAKVDFFLVGGSLVFSKSEETILAIKQVSDKPVYLFPGSVLQVSQHADGMFLISLISGRNPDFLIGHHVMAAPFLKNSGLDIVPVGYMLIDSGKKTSVQYMSNTQAIPYEKDDIAIATAIAGELTGKKLIYLEAGSGAEKCVSTQMIKKVKENINIPLIVGGGINTEQQMIESYNAGADIIIIGTAFEKDNTLIKKFSNIIESLDKMT